MKFSWHYVTSNPEQRRYGIRLDPYKDCKGFRALWFNFGKHSWLLIFRLKRAAE